MPTMSHHSLGGGLLVSIGTLRNVLGMRCQEFQAEVVLQPLAICWNSASGMKCCLICARSLSRV